MFLLLDLFFTFFQISLFTIGGGYAMIPLITEKVVSKGWATETDIIDYIAVAESTPGPFAVNTSTFVGMKQFGVLGAAVAVLGLVLPSFVIILLIAKFFVRFTEAKGVAAALNGLRPAVIGLMASAAVSIAIAAFGIKMDFSGLGFFADVRFIEVCIFVLVLGLSFIKKLKIDSYKIILVSAALGVAFYSARDFLA